jgi:hypothetical protein
MKIFIKLLALTIALVPAYATHAQTSEIIDNKKLVELAKAKLGDDLVIGFIQSSTTKFDCSMTAILQLKKDSVSEKVLAEVMKVCNSSKNTKTDESNNNNPLYVHPSGIYIYETGDTGYVLKKLYATVVTKEKSGGLGKGLLSAVTYGLAKSSGTAAVNGPTANVKCKSNSEFYFYFDAATTQNISLTNWWFSLATSPNEFTLLKLDKKKNSREFKTAKTDSYTYQSGIDEDQKVQFTFEEVKPGIFKVKTKGSLKDGEYSFIYSATVPSQYSNDKMFDFSVPK